MTRGKRNLEMAGVRGLVVVSMRVEVEDVWSGDVYHRWDTVTISADEWREMSAQVNRELGQDREK